MADLALVSTGKLNVVAEHEDTLTRAEGETLAVGDFVRLDTSTGKFTKANGTTAAEARVYGVVISRTAPNVTVLKRGIVDGFDVDSLTYDDIVYLSDTDGKAADAAGTVSTVLGRTVSLPGQTVGTAYDKGLQLEL